MRGRPFLSYFLIGSFIQLAVVQAASVYDIDTDTIIVNRRYYEFDITSELINPDCHEEGFSVPVINGQFPGPTIFATKNDEVEVVVRNMVPDHNTTIHFHGIRQIGTPESDGVPDVTQEPILPGESYRYRFKVIDQSGTFFYHAHVGLQDDTIKGALIVYESPEADPQSVDTNNENEKRYDSYRSLQAGPYTYDEDLILQLGEWWHETLEKRESYYLGPKFQFDVGADSILINGQTVYKPEKILNLPNATDLPDNLADVAENVQTERCFGYSMLDVQPNKTYRLRVIGSTTFRTLALAIKGHNMTLIEVDGELIEPYETDYLEISPGQRYSVLLKTGDFEPGTKFPIATNYMWRQRGRGLTENGFGFIRYVSASTDDNSNHDSRSSDCNDKLSKRQHVLEKHRDYDFEEEQVCFEGRGNCSNDSKIQRSEEKKGQQDGQVMRKEGNESSGSEEGQGRRGGNRGNTEAQGGTRRGGGGGGGGSQDVPRKVFIDVPSFPEVDRPDWSYHEIRPLAARDPIVDLGDSEVRTIKLATSYGKQADNTTRYMINGRIGHSKSLPGFKHYLQNLEHSGSRIIRRQNDPNTLSEVRDVFSYNEDLGTYPVKYNEVVDLVFQNTVNSLGGCLLHPWHTHGHSHHVIASGEGDYVHDRDKNIRNFEHPLYRDTTIVYPSKPANDSSNGCGWTKVRLLANNPGYWAVHCHITTHMVQGKMTVLEIDPFISY